MSRLKLVIKMLKEDERYPKLLGLLLLILAIYFSVAFISYIFTWKADQDTVMHNSWGILMDSEIKVENALGRLGAIISHQLFYCFVGLPAFAFVFLFATMGRQLLRPQPQGTKKKKKVDDLEDNAQWLLLTTLVKMMVVIFWLSLYLEFFLGGGEFLLGGAFGKAMNLWLTSFVGRIGLLILFLFSIPAIIIWLKLFDGVSSTNEMWYEMQIFLHTLLPNRFKGVLRLNTATLDYMDEKNKKIQQAKTKPKTPTSKSAKKTDGKATKKAKADKAKVDVEAALPKGQQLQLELKDKDKKSSPKEKPKPLKKGDGNLEINKNESDNPALPLSVEAENKRHVEPYDPTLELSSYKSPSVDLLFSYDEQKTEVNRAELEANKDQIIETLLNYKIEITKIKATVGPTVTLYEIVPAPGIRISKIKNLEDDIALSLAALGIRIIAPIPGRGTIGIEVPNKNKQIVALQDILSSPKFKEAKMDLPIGLGKTISNEVFVADLAKMPHLLIAGATGQGKSVGINVILMSLLYKKHPSQVKLVLIDPKKVELSIYSKIENHFLGYLPDQDEPIVTETSKVIDTLNSLCIEMEQRYDLLKRAHVRNLREYNQKFVQRRLNPEKGHRFLPYIVLVIDEFADLIMTAGKEIELPIGRLAQLARAVGIHLIIATQRPSVNIITGVIKANFPARMAYKVSSKIDSRTILDTNGADQLIGRGDMLLSVGGNMVRLQCAFVDTPEVEKVIEAISEQQGYPEPFFLPEYSDDDGGIGGSGVKYADFDDMFEDAAHLVVNQQQGSTSMLQRKLKLGYNRAGRIMDQLESVGIVGPSEGSKAREVLIYDLQELERYLNHLKNS